MPSYGAPEGTLFCLAASPFAEVGLLVPRFDIAIHPDAEAPSTRRQSIMEESAMIRPEGAGRERGST